jgi:hypothetical protein
LAAAQVAVSKASTDAHAEAAVNTTVTLCSTAGNFTGLAGLGLEIDIFCGVIYSVLLLKAILGARFLRAGPFFA